MNFSEFKEKLAADPTGVDSGDPGWVRARELGPEYAEAIDAAARFEQSLGAALKVPPPDGLLAQLRAIGERPVEDDAGAESRAAAAPARRWPLWAMAASVALAVAVTTWNLRDAQRWDDTAEYLAEHYAEDGPALVARATAPADMADIRQVLAAYGAEASDDLAGQIYAIKVCPTPHGRGAHMVLHTAGGPVTVIYMPGVDATDGERFQFNGMQARLVALTTGTAAVIGERDQALDQLAPMLRDGLQTPPRPA